MRPLFYGEFADFTNLYLQFYIYNFYIYIQLITLGIQSRSTDAQHVTSLHQITYVQRIRCSKNSPLGISNCISHLKMARRGRNV
jgi:hypothetical protein